MTEKSFSPAEVRCPVCRSTSMELLYRLKNVPVFCNVLHNTREEALQAVRGDLNLIFCNACGHIFNSAFDPALMAYTVEYENSLHFSAKFQDFADGLAEALVKKYRIKHKNIIEIGCGKGDFLKMICERGDNKGYGFDASYVFRDDENKAENITFYQEFYSDKFSNIPADLVLCRHVLEHIHEPYNFINEIKSAISKYDPVFYFEVPNALYTLRDMGIWDLIYEHYAYYNPLSISRLFQETGFHIYALGELYHKQFLGVEFGGHGINGHIHTPITLGELKDLVHNFRKSYEEKVKYWENLLVYHKNNGKKAAVWGGGSKGVTFLNVFNAYDLFNEIVDINPRKQGKYVAGTGQKYISPEELQDRNYDTVIVMNPVYTQEINDTMKSMGLKAELIEA